MAHIARKRFGQHFLVDQTVIRRIVSAIKPRPADRIVEIGPGQAALTQGLLDHCPHIEVIELDRDLAQWLEKKYPRERLTVHSGDVLQFNFRTLDTQFRLVGNLPYNISTPLLCRLIEFRDLLIDQHYMLQKEVVDRICAAPNTPEYGRLTVLLQIFFETEALFDVPPESFDPPPRVNSAIIRLMPSQRQGDLPPVKVIEAVLGAAFSQRRKMIRTTLLKWLEQEGIVIEQSPWAQLDGTLRPENLPVETYLQMALGVAAIRARA